MLRYMKQVLQQDIAIAPFELVAAEEDYRRILDIEVGGDQLRLSLGGKIDRIDRLNGLLRVIDYKTGRAELKFRDIESLFDDSYGNRNSAAMQTLYYAWLVGETFEHEAITPGLYSMRGIFEENFDPALFQSSSKEKVRDFTGLEPEFVKLLKMTLEKLYNPKVPFVQRERDMKCQYCDYSAICQRKSYE